MKATLTLIALLFTTTFAAASIAVQAPEVTPIIISVEVSTEEVKEVMSDKKEVALSFKTKKNKSKLA
jgi:hypothetical protein